MPYSARSAMSCTAGVAADVLEAADAVAEADEVAGVGEHAFLDLGVDGGVGGGDADVAAAPGLVDADSDAAAGVLGSALGEQAASEVAGDHDHVVVAALAEAGGVAEAAVGVAVHEGVDAGAGAEMEESADDGMVEQVFSDGAVGDDGNAEALQEGGGADA